MPTFPATPIVTPQESPEMNPSSLFDEDSPNLKAKPSTTSDSEAFDHFLVEVLRQPLDGYVAWALEDNSYPKFTETFSFMTEFEIDSLCFHPEDERSGKPKTSEPTQPLMKASKALIKAAAAFASHVLEQNGHEPLDPEQWIRLTYKDFHKFRCNYARSLGTPGTPSFATPSSPLTTATSSSSRTTSKASEFRKGVKRDITVYPIFKFDSQWDPFRRTFRGLAKTHGLEQMLDPTYVPKTDEDKELFKEIQVFAYSILDRVLQTDEGKAIVRKYESDCNAQAAWNEFCEHQTNSASAEIQKTKLMKHITTTRYDSSWRGSSKQFVLHWQQQVRIYHELCSPAARIADELLLTLLQNAVQAIPDLRTVKTQMTYDYAKTGRTISYSNYCILLIEAATIYDDEHSNSVNARSKNRVNEHQWADPQDENYRDNLSINETMFGRPTEGTIDLTPDEFYEINRHDSARPKSSTRGTARPATSVHLPKELWEQLTPELQEKFREHNRALHGNKPARQVNFHDLPSYFPVDNPQDLHQESKPESRVIESKTNNPLLAFATTHQPRHDPTDIRAVLSAHKSRQTPSESLEQPQEQLVEIDGKRYRQVNNHRYVVSQNERTKVSSLIDRGANGGLAGADCVVISDTNRKVDISGIDNHQITNLPIVTAAAIVDTLTDGPIVVILNQYAYLGQGKTIHSSGQIEHYTNKVDDRSKAVGGKQRIVTLEGYVIPLKMQNGLAYMDMRAPTKQELDALPHVILTSDMEWDPSVLDVDMTPEMYFEDVVSPNDPDGDGEYIEPRFDSQGLYNHRVIEQLEILSSTGVFDLSDCANPNTWDIRNHKVKPKEPDYEAMRPNFGWAPIDIIKRTLSGTTQYAKQIIRENGMRQHFKSRFPALNVPRRCEAVATDTVFSDTPAIDDGSTCAQLFVGHKSLVSDVYGMKSDGEFVNTLEDQIRQRGAMTRLLSDEAQAEISKKVKDILRAYAIGAWNSESHHQNQNPAETRYRTIKEYTNNIMNRTGAPPYTWLLCMTYVCLLLNHLACASLGYALPLTTMDGQTRDISVFQQYHFYQPVYFHAYGTSFPSESKERLGRWVGIAEHVGDALTYKVLTDDTKKIIHTSIVRPADNPLAQNKRANPTTEGEPDTKPIVFVKDRYDDPVSGESHRSTPLPGFDPDSLIGRTFLKQPEENGEQYRARIMRKIVDKESLESEDPKLDTVKFLLSIDDGKADEIVAYNEIVEWIARQDGEEIDRIESGKEGLFKFRDIVAHQGPLNPTHRDYKGSKYNVLVEWETGEKTYEPLDSIATDDPVTCAVYAKRNKLLETPGWKQFKRIAKRHKKMVRMVNQSKLRQSRHSPIYKFGFRVPRNHAEAVEIDKLNENTRWQDAEKLELAQIDEYDTFTDRGKAQYGHNGRILNAPEDYKKIRVHMVYDVKHDGRHKARLVADGHLTDVPVESVYSGVVSLRGLRLVVFLAELNQLELWGADIGNAYLEAKTREKLYIVAGPEFGERQGHVLIVHKALYGCRLSGKMWGETFSETLTAEGFTRSKADENIWMRPNKAGTKYEYIAVYVDDLALALENCQEFVDILKTKYNYKLKGDGPLSYHLGCDFERDEDGTLVQIPRKYIQKMMDQYQQMFGELPKESKSPLEKNDHPELDDSRLCTQEEIKKYQSMIGALQWLISLGRFDVFTATMTMSRFRVEPKIGHLERLKRVYGFVRKWKNASIRYRTEEPDYSDLPEQLFTWTKSIYGMVKELIPTDAPKPLGKRITLTTYVDANLFHDIITGRSVTAVLHLINKTPFDWFTRRQACVETATFGSEFTAARTAVDQIIDIRMTLRYLGVPVCEETYMFGDNESVVKNSTIPHSVLNKRHNALSYHRVREAIAAGFVKFYHIRGESNPADILSKHWGFIDVWPLLKPLLFWKGDTGVCPNTVKPETTPPHDRHKGECYARNNANTETDSRTTKLTGIKVKRD